MNGRVGDLDDRALRARLHGDGLFVRTGPLIFAIRSREAAVAEALPRLYADQALASDEFADFHVEVRRVGGLRGWVKPQVEFLLDGRAPFLSLPDAQAFAMLEWGMNWCIAGLCHQYLVIHAAVIARDGRAAILPAPPGSGKSTLAAALIQRGWRLCSDELTLIDPANGNIVALARPVNLKNQSIALIRAFAPDSVFGPEATDTQKGLVAHLKPPADSVARVAEPVRPRWIVFPRWQRGSAPRLEARPRAASFIELAENAFNYSQLGELGFTTLARVIDQSETLSFTYDRLDDAVETFEELAAR